MSPLPDLANRQAGQGLPGGHELAARQASRSADGDGPRRAMRLVDRPQAVRQVSREVAGPDDVDDGDGIEPGGDALEEAFAMLEAPLLGRRL